MSIGAWEPHWLGDPLNERYAALHRPEAGIASFAVLFVPPLLHEMPRSRRLLTEVASRLAAMGIPCLRFDYLGTGDAEGEADLVDFASMQADIGLAEQALRTLVPTERVVVMAWRASALPLAGWLNSGVRPEKVVLWEPISDGAEWLAKLEAEDETERALRRTYSVRRAGDIIPDDDQLMGFPVSPQFRQDIAATSLGGNGWRAAAPVWVLARAGADAAWACGQRVFTLPCSSPDLGGGSTIDATMFLSADVRAVVEELGHALLAEDTQ